MMSMTAVVMFALLNEDGAPISTAETTLMLVFFSSTTLMLFSVLYAETRGDVEGGEAKDSEEARNSSLSDEKAFGHGDVTLI